MLLKSLGWVVFAALCLAGTRANSLTDSVMCRSKLCALMLQRERLAGDHQVKRSEESNIPQYPLHFFSKRVPGMEFVGKRAPGMEFVGKRSPGMEFIGKRSGDTQSLHRNRLSLPEVLGMDLE